MLLHPLFDTVKKFLNPPSCVTDYIDSLSNTHANQEYQLGLGFLKCYSDSDCTFNAYRREIERFYQWAWLIAKKSLKDIHRDEIAEYLQFLNAPPAEWITTKTVTRFLQSSTYERTANPAWRPFVIRKKLVTYQLSDKSIQATIATLSSFFSFLQQEKYIPNNPINFLRNDKNYSKPPKSQTNYTPLTQLQWNTILNAAIDMAAENSEHERTYFILSVLHLLGIRISDLASTRQNITTMGSFMLNKEGLWEFMIIRKGKKTLNFTVPHELLNSLKRYREFLKLPSLPTEKEKTPLIPKIKGNKGLGSRQIRNVVQSVVDRAIKKLTIEGKELEAADLATTTMHWLRRGS